MIYLANSRTTTLKKLKIWSKIMKLKSTLESSQFKIKEE